MSGSVNPWLVTASLLVAIAVACVALYAVRELSRARGTSAAAWLTGGAVLTGAGVWAMHAGSSCG
jgi:diguanylate cyclase